MDDTQKIEAIKYIIFSRLDWMESYRQTVEVPDGIGLPSGITGDEVELLLIRRILEDKRIVAILKKTK